MSLMPWCTIDFKMIGLGFSTLYTVTVISLWWTALYWTKSSLWMYCPVRNGNRTSLNVDSPLQSATSKMPLMCNLLFNTTDMVAPFVDWAVNISMSILAFVNRSFTQCAKLCEATRLYGLTYDENSDVAFLGNFPAWFCQGFILL